MIITEEFGSICRLLTTWRLKSTLEHNQGVNRKSNLHRSLPILAILRIAKVADVRQSGIWRPANGVCQIESYEADENCQEYMHFVLKFKEDF